MERPAASPRCCLPQWMHTQPDVSLKMNSFSPALQELLRAVSGNGFCWEVNCSAGSGFGHTGSPETAFNGKQTLQVHQGTDVLDLLVSWEELLPLVIFLQAGEWCSVDGNGSVQFSARAGVQSCNAMIIWWQCEHSEKRKQKARVNGSCISSGLLLFPIL